jgi:hypothetical protein
MVTTKMRRVLQDHLRRHPDLVTRSRHTMAFEVSYKTLDQFESELQPEARFAIKDIPQFCGIPVYADPNVPEDRIYLVSGPNDGHIRYPRPTLREVLDNWEEYDYQDL